MVLSDIWNIVIFPTLTKWAVDILPLLTNIATQVLSVGDVLFENVKAVFDMIWQDAIAPAMQSIQDIWNDVWDSITNSGIRGAYPFSTRSRPQLVTQRLLSKTSGTPF